MLRKSIYMILIALMAVSLGCSKHKEEKRVETREEGEIQVYEGAHEEAAPLPEGGDGRYFSVKAEHVHEYMEKGAEVIDIRPREEFQDGDLGIIEGSINMPGGCDVDEMDEESPYILVSETGSDSRKEARRLVRYGFKYIYNLEGGMLEYRSEFPLQPSLDITGDDSMPTAPATPRWR